MKKQGISLITLIITVVVLIILAAAVMIAIGVNNPMGKAKLANIQSTRDNLSSGIGVYLSKVITKENGNYDTSTILLGKNSDTKKYQIISGDFENNTTNTAVILENKQIWQLDYGKVESLLNLKLDIYDNNSRWYIDEFGNPYLVYDRLSNVQKYLKDETGNVDISVRNFVVYLDQDVEFAESTQSSVAEPDEDLTLNVTITKNSNSIATISGFSRNGIKTMEYTGPRQGTLTPTMNGNYYTAVAYVGNGDYTFTITDNNDQVKILEETISGITSFTVSSAENLGRFRDYVNMGDDFAGVIVTQTADIDLSSVCSSTLGSWSPIGTASKYFSGIYDGRFHTISNMYINSNDYSSLGMFTNISSSSAIIRNLILENIYVKNTCNVSFQYTGAFAGYFNNARIEQCGVKSGQIISIKNETITGNDQSQIGGIFGTAGNARIDKCYNKANVSAEMPHSNNNEPKVGGIVGGALNNIQITNTYNTGSITASTGVQRFTGGIIADKWNATGNVITNCYNIGQLSGGNTGTRRNGWKT